MPVSNTAEAVLNRYYLETRCKIIEIAANLDRIDRGRGDIARDPRVARIREAIGVLRETGSGRAEKCQMIFSLLYEEDWSAPNAAARS